jgi:hypothetical protein
MNDTYITNNTRCVMFGNNIILMMCWCEYNIQIMTEQVAP